MKKLLSRFYFFGSIIVIMLSFGFLLYSNINVKADAVGPIEYNDYNYLINVYDLNYQDDFYLFNVIARIDNNNFVYIDGDNTGYAWKTDLDLSNFGLYLINATSFEPVMNFYYYFQLNQSISYETFLASYDSYSYAIGYNSGIEKGYQNGLNDGYDNGYDVGFEDGESDGYSTGLSAGYDRGYDIGYSAGLNAQVPDTQFSLFNLLGVIALFPFKILALGFDVDIFGVNVGGLMIGILIILFVFGLIGIAKSKF